MYTYMNVCVFMLLYIKSIVHATAEGNTIPSFLFHNEYLIRVKMYDGIEQLKTVYPNVTRAHFPMYETVCICFV